jgi:hypothetical protein
VTIEKQLPVHVANVYLPLIVSCSAYGEHILAVGSLIACCYRALNRISVNCARVNVTGLPLVLDAFIAPLIMPCS